MRRLPIEKRVKRRIERETGPLATSSFAIESPSMGTLECVGRCPVVAFVRTNCCTRDVRIFTAAMRGGMKRANIDLSSGWR